VRAKDFVTEAFDNPYAFNWQRGDHGDYDILVKLPDGSPLNIAFDNQGDDGWHVAFDRGHSQEITGEGDAQRIFATVLYSIKQFIGKVNPEKLYFSASKDVEPGQNPESRARLYERMVYRYAESLGYDVVVDDRRGHSTFILNKKQPVTEETSKPTMGINVRSDSNIDYASLIVDGRKKYESRETDSLRPYVGKTVAIVRTGSGPAVAIGQVTVGEPVVVDSQKFDKMRDQHLVPQGSKFDIGADATKYLYPMIDPVRWDSEKLVKQRGIVARKIQEQGVVEDAVKDLEKDLKHPHSYNAIDHMMKTIAREEGITAQVLHDRFVDKHDMTPDEWIKDQEQIKVTEDSFGGIDIDMDIEGDEIMVRAIANGRELGHVLFVDEGGYLMPQDLEVDERFQGQGIAAAMYDYVKSKGYKIRRSGQQTDAGAGFWGKHRPEQNVWENFADGKIKGKSRPGRVRRAGASCNGSVTSLRQRAKNASGERAKMYHWCANMKSGKKK
jgi:GNAT superfamily N-acetyltransferase/predicted transcriptional regulator